MSEAALPKSRYYDVDNMSLDDLRDAAPDLQAQMNSIKAQLDDAKRRQLQFQEAVDPAWAARAKKALRGKGWLHQRMLERIGHLNRLARQAQHEGTLAARAARTLSFQAAFVKVAKATLDPRLFESLCQAAELRTTLPTEDPPHE